MVGIVMAASMAIVPARFAMALYGGQQTYGACAYGGDCATSPVAPAPGSPDGPVDSVSGPATIIQLPSGLDVSINLRNGQLIPRAGYIIVVTPLNGRGTSFKQATFLINTNAPSTALPDATGTARWLWLPRQLPGTEVSIVVMGQDGQTITKHFTVRLTDASAASLATGVATMPKGVNGVVSHFLQALPKQVVYAFPYVVFVLLGLNIAVLLVQTYREAAEARTIRRRRQQVQLMADMKRTFTELASHYLRTPLTLINGGLEEALDGLAATSQETLRAITARLQDAVTRLIDDARSRDATLEQSLTLVRPYTQWSLWLPVAIAGTLAFGFDYLAENVADFAVGRVNVVLQAVVLALLAMLLYFALRFVQLRRCDKRMATELLAYEDQLARTHEQFVRETLARLQTDVAQLAVAISQISPSQSKAFIDDGVKRLDGLLKKFAIASQLRGTRSNAPRTMQQLAPLIQRAWQPLVQPAMAKHVTLAPLPDQAFACQSASLLALVCGHVLDNAVAYASDNSQIAIRATVEQGRFTLAITNSGAVIPADKLAVLLNPFVKGEGAETFNHEGMGFSLYIDKLILAYLGGAIHIDSQANTGTTVTMQLFGQPAAA